MTKKLKWHLFTGQHCLLRPYREVVKLLVTFLEPDWVNPWQGPTLVHLAAQLKHVL